jgi:MFS family permease
VLTAGGMLSAVLVAAVGLLADRFGRRRMLLCLGGLGAVGGAAMALTGNPIAVTVASGLGGVGRGGGAGSGGSWGPVFPAEQPLLAGSVEAKNRTAAFGSIAFVGVLAGAAGSLVAYLPDGLHASGWGWLPAYRLVFWLGAALSLVMLIVTLPVRETLAPAPAPGGDAQRQPGSLSTRQLIGRLTLTNGLNGLGVGFLGPLLTYWFHVRYGVGPGQLGLLYTLVNLVTALPYLGAARLAARMGAVRAVTVTRAGSAACLLLMAWMPTFALAGLVFAVRMALNSLGLPTRQSYVMGVADERRRGAVAALGMLPAQVTSSISPVIGGVLMESVLDTPLYGSALFITANLIAYYYAFRNVPPPEEARPAAHKAAD